jgi:hypothetical protein
MHHSEERDGFLVNEIFKLSKRKFLNPEQIISINLVHIYLLLNRRGFFQVLLESSFYKLDYFSVNQPSKNKSPGFRKEAWDALLAFPQLAVGQI